MPDPCQDTTDAEAALTASLTSPSFVSVDGLQVTGPSISSLIAASNYYAAKCAGQGTAAGGGGRRGLRLNRLIPDGCVQDSGRRGTW